MKVKDIAILVNKPEGTIKTLLHRARNHIKKYLQKEGYFTYSSEVDRKIE
ncbi:sigma factor-like helix-turn-helix DNA-binding protein [Desulforamulus ferrireducens]